jgi:antitoxin Phd
MDGFAYTAIEVISMMVNTNAMVSISEANQNFSRVAKMVDQNGAAIIMKNNKPRYLVIDFSEVDTMQTASNHDVSEISKKLIKKNKKAYEELAK